MKKIILLILMQIAISVSAQTPDEFLDNLRKSPTPFTKERIFDYFNSSEINPNDYSGYFQRGILNMENGFYIEAIQNFRHVIIPKRNIVGGEPEFAEPYFYIGICKTMLSEYDSAMYFFNKTIGIDPLHNKAYIERGILLLSQGEYEKALEDFEFSYMHDKKSANAMYNIGYCQYLLGNDRKAKSILKDFIKKYPDYYRSYLLLGYIEMSKERYKQAEKYFNDAVDRNPDDISTHFNRGLNRIRMGISNFDRVYVAAAYSDMQHVLEIDSANISAYSLSYIIKILLKEPLAAYRNKYLATKYILTDTLERAKIKPIELEEYYLLIRIFGKYSLRLREKELAQEFFKASSIFRVEVDIEPIKYYLKLNPSSIFINRLLAFYYLKTYDYENLDPVLNTILALDGSIAHLQSLRAELLIRNGSEEMGLKLFEMLININPEWAYLSHKLGNEYSKINNYEEAIVNFNRAIDIAPNYMSVYSDRARAYANSGNYRASIKDAVSLIFVEERYYYPWYLAGYSYNQLKQPDSAISFINTAIQLHPGFAPLHMEKANSYIQLGEYDKALETYKYIINDTEESAEGYYYRGYLKLDYLDDERGAIWDFEKARGLDPLNSKYYEAIGGFYFHQKKDYSRAIINYAEAISLNKTNNSLYLKISDVFIAVNEQDSAIRYLEKAISIDSTHSNIWYATGNLYRDLDSLDKAIECLLKAIDFDANSSNAYGSAGWIYYLRNDFEKSVEYSFKAVELDTTAYYAMFNHALATLCLGKVDKARALYAKYYEVVKDLVRERYHGAIEDLKLLVAENKMEDEARAILKDYFGVEM